MWPGPVSVGVLLLLFMFLLSVYKVIRVSDR